MLRGTTKCDERLYSVTLVEEYYDYVIRFIFDDSFWDKSIAAKWYQFFPKQVENIDNLKYYVVIAWSHWDRIGDRIGDHIGDRISDRIGIALGSHW